MRTIWAAVIGGILAAFAIVPAHAWGERGHSVVAEIAERHLTPEVAADVRAIVGHNASLASIASWADDVKYLPDALRTQGWHYVDINVAADHYAPSDCPAKGCLVSALTEQATILTDRSRSAADRRTALMYLVHLVGDSTQPFHCAEREGDRGGNSVRVTFTGFGPDHRPRSARTTLHAAWDDNLVMVRAWSWGSYVDRLETQVLPHVPAPVVTGDWGAEWVDETHAVAREVYALTPADTVQPVNLDAVYQDKVNPIIDRQLAIGGARLAAILNRILAY